MIQFIIKLFFVFSADLSPTINKKTSICFILATQGHPEIEKVKISKNQFAVESFQVVSINNSFFEAYESFITKNVMKEIRLSFYHIEVFLMFENTRDKLECDIELETKNHKITRVGPFMLSFNEHIDNYDVNFLKTHEDNLTCVNMPLLKESKDIKGIFLSVYVLKNIKEVINNQILKDNKNKSQKSIEEEKFIERTPKEKDAVKPPLKFEGEFKPKKKKPEKHLDKQKETTDLKHTPQLFQSDLSEDIDTFLEKTSEKHLDKQKETTDLKHTPQLFQSDLSEDIDTFLEKNDGKKIEIKEIKIKKNKKKIEDDDAVKRYKERWEGAKKSKVVNNGHIIYLPSKDNLIEENKKYNKEKIDIADQEIRDCVNKVLEHKIDAKTALKEYEEIVDKRMQKEHKEDRLPELWNLRRNKRKETRFYTSEQLMYLIYIVLMAFVIVVFVLIRLIFEKLSNQRC